MTEKEIETTELIEDIKILRDENGNIIDIDGNPEIKCMGKGEQKDDKE